MGLFAPDRYFSRVSRIDVDRDLLGRGLRFVLLDIDNTIRRRDNREVPLDARVWLDKVRERGVSVCLLSNNCHANAYDLADELGLPIVAKAMKPLPFGYMRATRMCGASVGETVMVGDQICTDVVGAKLVGMKSYLIAPLVEQDLPHMAALRHIERRVVGDRIPEGAPTSVSSQAKE